MIKTESLPYYFILKNILEIWSYKCIYISFCRSVWFCRKWYKKWYSNSFDNMDRHAVLNWKIRLSYRMLCSAESHLKLNIFWRAKYFLQKRFPSLVPCVSKRVIIFKYKKLLFRDLQYPKQLFERIFCAKNWFLNHLSIDFYTKMLALEYWNEMKLFKMSQNNTRLVIGKILFFCSQYHQVIFLTSV